MGRLGGAVGLRGELEVEIASDDPRRFEPGSVILTADRHRPLTVRSLRRTSSRTVVSFDGVSDRTQAEALRGCELVVARESARSLEEDEYWDHDLVGCMVVTPDGEEVGEVKDVLHAPANDVLVVAGAREHLIPLISDVVRAVEPGQRIVVDPLPGLLDY